MTKHCILMKYYFLILIFNIVICHLSTEHKLVLVGLDNAGKTTILYQLLLGEAVHTRPTIGSNVEEVVWRNLRFVMWDLGGQQSLRSAWTTYYTNSEDVKGSMTAAEISEQLDLTSIKQHPWHIQACCALTGEGYASLLTSISFIHRTLLDRGQFKRARPQYGAETSHSNK
ncbi:hypothetical protein SFRURICE_016561, partial [Spodoptera frugiperda]